MPAGQGVVDFGQKRQRICDLLGISPRKLVRDLYDEYGIDLRVLEKWVAGQNPIRRTRENVIEYCKTKLLIPFDETCLQIPYADFCERINERTIEEYRI